MVRQCAFYLRSNFGGCKTLKNRKKNSASQVKGCSSFLQKAKPTVSALNTAGFRPKTVVSGAELVELELNTVVTGANTDGLAPNTDGFSPKLYVTAAELVVFAANTVGLGAKLFVLTAEIVKTGLHLYGFVSSGK